MTVTLPPPSQLLGIDKWEAWRPGQDKVFSGIMDWLSSPARFLGLALPTGGGKSACSLLAAKMSGRRTVILTASKGLQSQYAVDAAPLGGVLAMGQNNFRCTLNPALRADEGPCHEGYTCSHRDGTGCPYRDHLNAALNSKLVITNYAYYLAQTNFSSGLGDVQLLIADEGHTAGAFASVENFLALNLSRLDVEPLGLSFPAIPPSGTTPIPATVLWAAWRAWAVRSAPTAKSSLAHLESELKPFRTSNRRPPTALARAYRTAKSVVARLEKLVDVGEDAPWVIQQTMHGYRFTPTWVSGYSSSLFGNVPKVMLMSAILSHKTADALGVPPAPDRMWIESPSYFPAANTPIWHVPTARINYRTDDYGSTIWCTRIDQIISRRLDRKGIVFTVSYDRARLLLSRSAYRHIMFTHSTNDVVQVVEQFKKAPAPAILVSPTVTTGWDFAESSGVRYIIVGKLPYPDTKDPVLQARVESDPDWPAFLTMEVLIQESGRATRSSEARVEVLVVDNSVVWFMKLYRKFAPAWFLARYRGSLGAVPNPLV